MNNKQHIQKLRDNAELAMATYGYFHLVGKKFDNKDEYGDKRNKPITLHDILDSTYKGYVTSNHTTLINPEYLNGDFSPLQARRFFERYDLLIHQPNTETGFSATLFGEKRKQKNIESKEKSYTSEYGYINYIFAIRGTKPDDIGDLKADARLVLSSIPQGQYEDMLRFYNQCKIKYPAMTESKSLNIVGHSLGGALTQMLALSLCDDKSETNINEVSTFNSPGARDLKPPYDLISNDRNIIYQKAFKKAKDLLIYEKNIEQIVSNAINRIDKILNNQYLGITFDFFQRDLDYIANINYAILDTSLVYFYKTLIKNYENRYAKDDKGDNYKLSISNRVYHIETDDDNDTENNKWQDNLIQNLGKDIAGNHYMINIGLGLQGLEYFRVGKWFDSHTIVPTTQTLYFYSYLLELDSNYDKVKDKSLSECIEYCNKFMNDIKIHLKTFVMKINKDNKRSFEIKNRPFTPFRDSPKEMDFLEIFLSSIAVIIGKSNKELLVQGKSYYTSSMHPTIPKESIIDFIITLSNDGYYISILDKEYFARIRKECDYINDINNVGYKACLAEYRNFIIINKNNQTIENKDNLALIYGYDSSVYIAVHNNWCETSLGSHCKIIQGLYYNGKAIMFAVKGA